jgi:predicted aspartyl protease
MRLLPAVAGAVALWAALAAAPCIAQPAPRWIAPAADLTLQEVARLERARDYFALRERIRQLSDSNSVASLFARALVEHAMNRPAASNEVIARLLRLPGLGDSLAAVVRGLEMDNHLRLFAYPAGLAAAAAVLATPAQLDSEVVRDTRNTERIFRALVLVPPQSVRTTGPTRLTLAEGRIPVSVNDSSRRYVFDTGANLSTIMRSEAQALGLRILPVGIDVGSSTDRRVTADLAVADRLSIGAMEFRNVVFLVLDDELLTFPGGFRIPGIVGFPVIEQMGEVHLRGTTELYVPAAPPRRTQQNLALAGLALLTPVQWERRALLCGLDTGADRTLVYEHFYRTHRTWVDERSRPAERRIGGAGGVRATPVRVLTDVRLATGDSATTLKTLDVLLQRIVVNDREDYVDCNLGHDVFDSVSETIVNFRDMAFVLR